MPNPAVATPAAVAAPAADRNAVLCQLLFGHPVRQDAPLEPGEFPHARGPAGAWHFRWEDEAGGAHWHRVPTYDRTADHAARLRRRLCELGYDVGLFAEGGPQWAPPLGGRVTCLVRSCGVPVARGVAAGPHAEAEATAAAAHALVTAPGWRTPEPPPP